MKALVYTDVETLTYRDAAMPEVGAGQSLVKIMASGICGSDMHAFLGHDERRPRAADFGA
jgi:L-iditol 2-dehydrogenase